MTRVISRGLMAIVLGASAVYFLIPLVWVMFAATKDNSNLFSSFGLWFSDPSQFFDNMYLLFTQNGGVFGQWLGNSALYAGVGGVCATIFAAAAGYAFAKFSFPGREVMYTTILGGVLVPATALALPLYLLASRVGMVNTVWAVLLPSMLSPFGVYLSRVYAESAVSTELLEAARLDAAGEFRIFRSLVLRLIVPALATVFLFQFVSIWNNYFLSLVMLSNERLYPITLGLSTWYNYADRLPVLYQLTVAGAFVAIVPLVVIIFSLQRYWRAGIAEGALKG